MPDQGAGKWCALSPDSQRFHPQHLIFFPERHGVSALASTAGGIRRTRTQVAPHSPASGFVACIRVRPGRYWVDVPAIAEMCGLPRDTPLVEVVGTTPKQKEATSEELKKYLEFPVDPSHHLQYAATWFALSAATAVIARGAVKKQWARQSRRAA